MDYRLYFYGWDDHIVRAEVLTAGSEAEALERARTFPHAGPAELWLRDRLLHRFEAGELGLGVKSP